MKSESKAILRRILKEIMTTLMASILLLVVARVFLGKEKIGLKNLCEKVHSEFSVIWDQDDLFFESLSDYFTKAIRGSDSNSSEEYRDKREAVIFDQKLDELREKYDESIVNEFFRLKVKQWLLRMELIEGLNPGDEKEVFDIGSEEFIVQKIGINSGSMPLNQLFIEMFNTPETAPGYYITGKIFNAVGDADDVAQLFKRHDSSRGRIELKDTPFLGYLIKNYRPENLSIASENILETTFYIAFSVFFITLLVALMSRFLVRLIAASYIQDLVTGKQNSASFKTGFLPYLFSIPAFIWASFISKIPNLGVASKLGAILFILVVAGGLTFELLLKYLEQSRMEFNKPYARYLYRYKGDRSRKGFLTLVGSIFMPARHKVLAQSDSLDPFVLTGADYQLMDYVKRRLTVIVDAYALAGIIFSFTLWQERGKPDLVNMLVDTAKRDGFSPDIFIMIEAILLGILASKIVLILSSAKQFPEE